MHNILIRPLITEKMTNISTDQPGKYGFIVNPKSNKVEIANAIEKKFNVHVTEVKTMNHNGKTKTQFRKLCTFGLFILMTSLQSACRKNDTLWQGNYDAKGPVTEQIVNILEL